MVSDSLEQVCMDVTTCRLCPRLVEWREKVAAEKRASYRDWEYAPCGLRKPTDERLEG